MIDYDSVFEEIRKRNVEANEMIEDAAMDTMVTVDKPEHETLGETYSLISGGEQSNLDLGFVPDKIRVFDIELAKSRMDSDSVKQLVAKADSLMVESDAEAKKAVSLALQSRKMGNAIEKTRKAIVRPHLDFQKSIKMFSDEFAKCLKDMEVSLLAKVDVYQEQRKKMLQKENIIDTSFDEISVEDGSGKTVTKWVFNVEDISLIPIEYLNVNEKAVKKAINNGIRDIPGVNIKEETQKQYRIRK